MDNNLYTQVIVLIHFFVSGIKISFLFDIFRSIRRAVKTSDIITSIQDIIYWCMAGAIIIYTIIRYTNGEIRAYMVLGIVLGTIIYFRFVSKLTIKIITKFWVIAIFPFKKINKLVKKD